jgi:ribosomal protein L40E
MKTRLASILELLVKIFGFTGIVVFIFAVILEVLNKAPVSALSVIFYLAISIPMLGACILFIVNKNKAAVAAVFFSVIIQMLSVILNFSPFMLSLDIFEIVVNILVLICIESESKSKHVTAIIASSLYMLFLLLQFFASIYYRSHYSSSSYLNLISLLKLAIAACIFSVCLMPRKQKLINDIENSNLLTRRTNNENEEDNSIENTYPRSVGKVCDKCQSSNSVQAAFCGKCGEPLPNNICPNCSNVFQENAKFCGKCGSLRAT